MWFDIFSNGNVFLMTTDQAGKDIALQKWVTNNEVSQLKSLLDPVRAGSFTFADPSKPEPLVVVENGSAKPRVTWIPSPNHSSRSGVSIQRIINHYTACPLADSAISWFQDPASQVSAHYIIDKDGTIYQMVKDSDKAWHACNENADSIGIEHVAENDEMMTKEQEKATICLHKWLMTKYGISPDCVTGHKFTPSNIGQTTCPDSLFGVDDDGNAPDTDLVLRAWVQKHLVG